jgi:hypothetical protein
MIDDCKDILFYNSADEMNKVLQKSDVKFKRERTSSITGEPILDFDLLNLRMKCYPMQKMIVTENSLHKLRHENNYCDFTLSSLKETCEFLSDSLDMPASKIRVQRFEFALIIETEEVPQYYFNRFTNLRLKPFYDMPPPANRSLPIERYCPFTQYKVKFYNAGEWNGVRGKNLLKGEIQFHKMQRVHGITGRHSKQNPINLSDLTDKSFLDRMAHFHLNTYRAIEKIPVMDCSQLNHHTRDFLYAGLLTEYWDEEERINPHTKKKKRARYSQLRKEVNQTGNEPFKELEQKFIGKYSQLINS